MRNSPIKLTLILIFGVVIFWLLYPIVLRCFFSKWPEAGVFGDSFGALNTLFTGLAFAVVFGSLRAQAAAIEEDRAEIARLRDLQKGTLDAAKLQADALLKSARLQALVGRIEAYTSQINLTANHDTKDRMRREQHTLLGVLDEELRSQGH